MLYKIQGGNSEKTLVGGKGEKCGPFWSRWKCGPFCGQLSAEGANASAKGTKPFPHEIYEKLKALHAFWAYLGLEMIKFSNQKKRIFSHYFQTTHDS